MLKSLGLLILLISTQVSAAEFKFLGQDYPPLNYQDGANVSGAVADIVKDACSKIAEKCIVEIQPLKRATMALETGDAAAVVTLIQTPVRDGLANYVPVFKANQVYWSTAKVPSMTAIAELKGKTAVAVAASASLKMVNEHAVVATGVTVKEENDNETIIKKLSAERLGDNAVALVNELPGNYYIKKNGITNLKINHIIKSETYGIYFPKKNRDQAFVDKFTAQIEAMKKDGSLKKVLDKYSVESL